MEDMYDKCVTNGSKKVGQGAHSFMKWNISTTISVLGYLLQAALVTPHWGSQRGLKEKNSSYLQVGWCS